MVPPLIILTTENRPLVEFALRSTKGTLLPEGGRADRDPAHGPFARSGTSRGIRSRRRRAGPDRTQPSSAETGAARARTHVPPRARQRTGSPRSPPRRRAPSDAARPGFKADSPHTPPGLGLAPSSSRRPSGPSAQVGGEPHCLPSCPPLGERGGDGPPGSAYRRCRTAPAGARPHRPRRRPRRGRGRGGIPAGGGAGARLRSRPLAAPPLRGRSGWAGLSPPRPRPRLKGRAPQVPPLRGG